MGEVYKAEQRIPIHRTVALKLIKAGKDTKEFIARFENERQVLAVLNHPNIATVHDAGAIDPDCPYFVMEFVDGQQITEYCDQHQLGIIKRLELFVGICLGVHHAHQKGIIHRDIKPSNILVKVIDNVPTPKIIDFGLARTLVGQIDDLLGKPGEIAGTLAYMAPIESGTDSVNVDACADVYSLGVVLYELLAGVRPLDFAKAKDIVEALQILRKELPLPPSARLAEDRKQLFEVASARGCPTKALRSQIKGDLDWIALKCLAKDRAQRYQSVSELRADVERYLRNQPLDIPAPSFKYRTTKFVRRHRVLVASGTLIALALVGGISASTTMYLRADRERRRAESAEKQATTVSDFMIGMVSSAHPGREGKNVTVLESLDKASDWIHESFTDDPPVEMILRETVGDIYLRLGQFNSAKQHFEAMVEAAKNLSGDMKASALNRLADYYYYSASDFNQAELLHQDALQLRGSQFDAKSEIDHAGHLYEAGAYESSLAKLDYVYRSLGETADNDPLRIRCIADRAYLANAVDDLETAEAWYRWVDRKYAESEAGKDERATNLNNLGMCLLYQHMVNQAEPFITEAYALRREMFDENHFSVLNSLEAFAYMSYVSGNLAEAEQRYRELLRRKEELFSQGDHVAKAWTLVSLAAVLADANRADEAESLRSKGDGMYLRRGANLTHSVWVYYFDRGRLRRALHDVDTAAGLLGEALTEFRNMRSEENAHVAMGLSAISLVLRDKGDFAEAERLCKQALEMRKKVLGEDHSSIASSLLDLASILKAAGNPSAAELILAEAVARRESLDPPIEWLAGRAKIRLGECLTTLGRFDEAAPYLEAGYAALRSELGESDPRTLEAAATLTQNSAAQSQAP